MEEETREPPLFIGLNMPSVDGRSSRDVVETALNAGYDMITCRITSSSYRKRVTNLYEQTLATEPDAVLDELPGPELDELLITPGTHISNTIALASPWVELDARSPSIATLSLQVLQHEFMHATFVGVTHVMISGPKRRTHIAQYAQAVRSLMQSHPRIHVVIHLPFSEDAASQKEGGPVVPPQDPLSVWELWHMVRTACNYPLRLSVALQVPKTRLLDYVESRWFAEPVIMLVINPKVFVANPKGYPVLPKWVQSLFFSFFRKRCYVLFEQNDSGQFTGGNEAFLMYIRHLYRVTPPLSHTEQFAAMFSAADSLQTPLQPLADDLDSGTYEVFEKDLPKYNQYEKAIYHAILDRPNKRIVMAVVGAGRGAIVDRALKAAKTADRECIVYAVEKNPPAYAYLCQKQRDKWGESVNVIKGDMRTPWAHDSTSAPPLAAVNIIISELLGSFGENEASPECLDGVYKYLDPNDGVMIPSSYSSYITPIMAPKLYTRALSAAASNAAHCTTNSSPIISTLQVPYVVMMQQVEQLSDEIKQVWRFEHPCNNKVLASNRHNMRHSRKTFSIPRRCVVHGFAGYFDAVLYKDIELTTRPEREDSVNPGMVSWFPIWFPLSSPMYLIDDSEIDLSMWRLTDSKRVWYEWMVESFAVVANGGAVVESGRRESGMSMSSSKSSLTAARRVRTGASELHNIDGEYYHVKL